MRDAEGERGFSLIEVVIVTAVFVFVAVAGFETLRQLGTSVTQLATRANAAAALNATLAQLRSDAFSAAAVWVPNATCGSAAVSLMRRTAAGTSFTTYVARNGTLARATAAGPIDPCSATISFDTVLANVTAITTTPIAASALASQPDGALFRASGITGVAVDAHARDYDGSPIFSGNGIVHVAIDTDPMLVTADLLAGNRPSGYTVVLTYACGARCAANGSVSTTAFPELRGTDATTCSIAPPDLPDTSAYYGAASTGLDARGRIIVTAYRLHLRYQYLFAGGMSPPEMLERIGPAFVWPAAANLTDPYPVDYASNTLKTNLASVVAIAPPSGLSANDDLCNALNAEHVYRG